ncbi:MAG: hypothetical protein A2901_01825 [Elusimicrobia bacterium RIFCSPLOWO2_01_FULL_54_10]|nr:MAG: hypothetical protein A2901_01825 [Elusimicrobia bacterium RIFCSPLOWO2_01_FULL_54_10]
MIVQERPSAKTEVNTQSLKVLLIEDNAADAKLIRFYLSESRRPFFAIERAETLADARKYLETATPDVILLDLSLPDSLWYETFESLSGKAAHIPIIILTGMRHETHAAEALRKGAQDCLTKGELEPPMLVRAILHAIERHRAQTQMRGLNTEIRGTVKDDQKFIRFSQMINAASNLKELSRLLSKTIPIIFHMKTFSLFLHDEETGTLKLMSHNHREWRKRETSFVIPEDDGLMWNAIRLKNPVSLAKFSRSRFSVPGISGRHEGDNAIVIPLTAKDITLGVLNLNNPFPDGLSENNMSNIIRISNHLSMAMYNLILLRHIENLTITDELTQIYNRRYLWQGLHLQAEAFARHGRPFSVLMIDIDHFKKVNDLYGHSTGDLVLKKTAQHLGLHLRAVDFLCRFGGEEFVAVFAETSGETALTLAERIRESFAAQKIPIGDGREISATVSIGITEYAKIENISDLIDRADRALYKAKENGRNQCFSVGIVK